MTPDLEHGDARLTREDEVLARVVVDLGLATALDVRMAMTQLAEARSKGEGKTLSDVLRERGCLRPRFASAVEKAVRARLAADSGRVSPEAARPPAVPVAPPQVVAPEAEPRSQAQQAAPLGPSAESAGPPVAPLPAAHLEVPAAAKDEGGSRSARGDSVPPPPQGEAPRPTGESPGGSPPPTDDVRLPEAATYKPAPKGEGFSVRSKKDVASAWAAYRKGAPPAQAKPAGAPASRGAPEAAVPPPAPDLPGGGAAGPDLRPAPALKPRELRDLPVTPPEPSGAPRDAAGRLAAGRSPGLRDRPGAEKETRQKGFTPTWRRIASSGVTQQIDIESIKAELGIDKKEDTPPAEPEAVPRDAKQREIALRAFIRRVLPGTVYQRCLEATLKRRLTLASPARLAEEAGISEREAKRVLDDWRSAGVVRQDDPEIFQYQFAPSKADLATIKEFMTLWQDDDWHRTLLGWIVQEEAR